MSSNGTAIFTLEDVRYGDFSTRSLFDTRFWSAGAARISNYAETRLQVWHPPGSNISRYRWEHSEIWFYTDSGEQVLVIHFDSPQIMSDEKARFHFHRIHANDFHWIRRVEHKAGSNGTFADLDDIFEEFPPHTDSIRLTFCLPGQDPPTSFKLSVFAKDRDHGFKSINCDPLVGNDPPGNNGQGP